MASKPYTIEIRPHAERDFRKLAQPVQRRIAAAIDALATTPRPASAEKLSGGNDYYRIRMGDYRILYEVDDADLVILVIRIGHRREVDRRKP